MIKLKDILNEVEKRFEIPQNTWTPIMRSELPRFKRIIYGHTHQLVGILM